MITTNGLKMATTLILTVFIILEAGCNNVLGYTQVNCHGENVNYERIRGIYTEPRLKYGYNFIARIPTSARNISVNQHRLTINHLALKKDDNTYIINGNFIVNQPGNFLDCGTVFTYHQNQDAMGSMKEYVHSPGPTNQPVELWLWATQVNVGITYEYDSPKANVTTSVRIEDRTNNAAFMSKNSFVQHRVNHERNNTIPNEDFSNNRRRHWHKYYIWTTCPKSCGDITYETSICVHHSTQRIVSESQCSTERKPLHDDRRCNITNRSCLPVWEASEWSQCSVTCGEGVNIRKLECKQLNSFGYPTILDPRACSTPRPPITRKCHLRGCDVITTTAWDVGQWSKCSASCGKGFKTRTVTCRLNFCRSDDMPPSKESCYTVCEPEGTWITLKSKVERPSIYKYECRNVEPPKMYRGCKCDESCSGQWFNGPWQMCSGVCNEEIQKRDIVCLAKIKNEFVVVPEHNCKPEEKPEATRKCKRPECTAMWYTTEWSQCSRRCGGGEMLRKVYCVRKTSESNLCSENSKPPESQPCNNQPCTPFIDDDQCLDKSLECIGVRQARMCNFPHFRELCCLACADAKK